MGKDTIEMSRKEIKRIGIIQKVIEKQIAQRQAAALLDLTDRQIRRILKRFRKEGAKGLIHQARGRASNRQFPLTLREKVLGLCKTRYEGFGPSLAQEKLLERDKIRMSRETLRQWLLEAHLWQRRRQGLKHRLWRARKACFGEMIQMDGSHHDWLEKGGTKLVLIAYIDDATNHIFARFYEYEGTLPAMDSFYRYLTRYGLPQSVYLDRHSAYWVERQPTLEDDLAGRKRPQSQFERALDELGIQVIHAYSPQAKGRIERLFGTLQDRLVKEMRLEGIQTCKEANRFLEKYLPKHNRRFRKEPQNSLNLHRLAPSDQKLKRALCVREKRILRNDNTVRYNQKLYLLRERWNGSRPKYLHVEERLDGRLYLVDRGREIRYRPIDENSLPPRPKPAVRWWNHRVIPKPDHPWRKDLRLSKRFNPNTNPQTNENVTQTLNLKPDISKLQKIGHF